METNHTPPQPGDILNPKGDVDALKTQMEQFAKDLPDKMKQLMEASRPVSQCEFNNINGHKVIVKLTATGIVQVMFASTTDAERFYKKVEQSVNDALELR